MKKIYVLLLVLLGLVITPIVAQAQSSSPFDIADARLNGLTSAEGTRYVLILPYNNTDALYNLRVTIDLPSDVLLITAQQTDAVTFVGVSRTANGIQAAWRASEILSGDLFAPFAFTLTAPINEIVTVTIAWQNSLNQPQQLEALLFPNTLNAVSAGASFNPVAPIPAGTFTFIGDTGVVIYSPQALPATALTIRQASPDENPPAELGDFWWCSGLELQGASGITVYVPLRKPLPPLMPLALFAQIDGVWQVVDVAGYVSADGLYAVYDHPGGLIFTGTDDENNPQEAPPVPPPDSDGDGFTDDVDACPFEGDAGFGVDGAGCPNPPPPPPDSDGDGFTDDVDACPFEGNAGFGVDGAGCPNPPPVPPDSDGDGFRDDVDACPSVGDTGFGVDNTGCPNLPPPPSATPIPPDTDGDGVPDFADACPEQGDIGFGLDTSGCPILPPPDSDGDGVPDFADACPEQGDIGFGLDTSGCPFLPTFTPTSESVVQTITPQPSPTLTPTAPPPPLPELVLFGFSAPNIVFGRTAQAQIAIAEPSQTAVRVQIQVVTGGTNVAVLVTDEVIIPTGETVATLSVFPNENKNGFITLRASLADNPSSRLTANLFVLPLSITQVSINSTRLIPGQITTGTVQIASPPEFDTSIALISTSPDVLVSPVIMPAGATSVSFDVRVNNPISTSSAQLIAGFGDMAIFGTQTLVSAPVPIQASITYQMLLPATISTPGTYTGEIVLSGLGLPTDSTITLSSSHPDVVLSSTSLLFPSGATRVAFTFSVTDGNALNQPVTINAVDATTGTSTSGTLQLNTLRVRSVRISDASVNRDGTTSVAVSLNAPVPNGTAGVVISLNQADVVAELPVIDADLGLYRLDIPQGASSGNFTIRVLPTLPEDAILRVTAILPTDVATSADVPILANLRVVSFDFGRVSAQPGTIVTGRISLNIPALRDTIIRLVPVDGVAFSTNFINQITIPAGAQSVEVPITLAGTINTARVGIIAFVDGQTPSQGTTGFFTVLLNTPAISTLRLTNPVLGVDVQTTELFVTLDGTITPDTTLQIEILADDPIASMIDLSNVTANIGRLDLITINQTPFPIRLVPDQFLDVVINDVLELPIRVTLRVAGNVVEAVDSQTIVLQVRPFVVPGNISLQHGGAFANVADLTETAVNNARLVIPIRGARVGAGGTLQLSSTRPDLVTVQSTVDVPANSVSVSVPLRFVSDFIPDVQQEISFLVSDVTGSVQKSARVTFTRADVESMTIVPAPIAGEFSAQIRTNAGSVTVSCENPCYFFRQPNETVQVPRGSGNNAYQTVTVGMGRGLSFASFDGTPQTTGILARAGSDVERATLSIPPSASATADFGFAGTTTAPFLSGNVRLIGTLGSSSVNLTMTSSHPNIIPPTFYRASGNTCLFNEGGASTRLLTNTILSSTWCMEVRPSAIIQPTAVVITVRLESFDGFMNYTNTKSFTINVSPVPNAPAPTNTPIPLAPIATPITVAQVGQNVTLNIATNTPLPTATPVPTAPPPLPVVQSGLSTGITAPLVVVTPQPISLTISVNMTTRRGTVSISSTRNTDVVVNLTSSNHNVVGVPSSVTIPRGAVSTSFSFTVNTKAVVVSPTSIRITATSGVANTSANITVRR